VFERFTERARQVVLLAQEAARDAGRDRIDTVALLYGLLREEEGLGARSLRACGVEDAWPTAGGFWGIEGLPEEPLEVRDEQAREQGHNPLRLTAAAKKVLELALREALSLGHNYVGTEHVVLALVCYQECAGSHVLRQRFGVDAERVRSEVIRGLTGPGARPKRKPRVREPARLELGLDHDAALKRAAARALLALADLLDALTQALNSPQDDEETAA
jgi:ATP-dependent Clp protease ATP-binding subunit ClpC